MALSLPVVVAQVSELFLNRREGTPLEAVDQAGYGYGGRKFTSRRTCPALPWNSASSAPSSARTSGMIRHPLQVNRS